MDRRLFLSAIAATAWGQQTSAAAADAEKALRARAEQFYQLEVDGKYRQAEAMIAEDSQDYFYNGNKPQYKAVTVESIALSDNNTRAKVTSKAKTQIMFPTIGPQIIEISVDSNWKLENGEWCWYFDKNAALITPFGQMNYGTASGATSVPTIPNMPNLAELRRQVTIDKTSVVLTDEDPAQSVTLTNHMVGAIGITLDSTKLSGATAELQKSQLAAGETAEVRFRLLAKGKKAAGTVGITCSPLGQQFEVRVTAN